MYVYFKGEHIAAKPMIKTFIEAYSKAWSKGGPLEKRGLVPLSAGDADAATKQATALPRSTHRPSSKSREATSAMTMTIALVAVLAITIAAGLYAHRAATALRRGADGSPGRLNSLPIYHAFYVGLWTAFPALLFLAIWGPVQSHMVDKAVLATPAGQALPAFEMQRDAILREARDIASGAITTGYTPESTALASVYAEVGSRLGTIGTLVATALAIAGAVLAMRRIKVDFRARNGVERWIMVLLVGASLIAILTTLGIVLSLLFESLRFFGMVSPTEFLFGTTWSPQTAMRADQAGSSGAFGSVPLFWGTAFIGAIIAMIVAIPLGLMSAIFLTQYARPQVRAWLKPILEILAGFQPSSTAISQRLPLHR
jgi:phosphate transport system permease protein